MLPCAPALAEGELPAPPYADEPGVQSQTTTTVTTTTRSAPAAPAQPTRPPAAIAPVPAVPAVPAVPPVPGAITGPVYYNGPVWVVPAPVTGQRPSMVPSLPPPPVYSQPWAQPGYRARTASCCGALPATGARYAVQRGPIFSLGLRFTAMGINQEVFGENQNLMGGGLQLRFRNRGHWGAELGFDILHANIGNDAFVRTSYPISAGAMIYIFRNRPENHFNIYGLVGLGLMPDNITLYKGSRAPGREERSQRFLEYMGQAGGGVELRFRRLALSADIRAIGLLLDGSGPAGSYYTDRDVDTGPVPMNSVGYKANVGAHLWF
jgi:hypothetical protein